VAFALNRISLLGKDQSGLVKFMSKVGIKKFIGVTLFISLILSAVKFFKYSINYELSEFNFPFSNDLNIFQYKHDYEGVEILVQVYFIMTFISDLLNYVVLFIICFVIDIWMVIKLRRTLNEKYEKCALMIKS